MLLAPSLASGARPIPATAGIGLRAPHYRAALEQRPAVGFFEAHSENFFGDGGAPLAVLEALRRDYPLSLHGVGMSLGSVDPLDTRHLARLRRLIQRYQPALVSEHLSFSSVDGVHFNDLAPIPYTQASLDLVCAHIDHAQEALGRQLLVENVSSYLEYRHSTMPEWEFLADTARRTGCGLLLDLNNLYVSARNHGWDPEDYLAALPPASIGQFHLAGHTARRFDGVDLLIDTHDAPVARPVWDLYRRALALYGPRPTLIEWDSALPPLADLVDEATRAQSLLEVCHARAA